MTVTLQLAAARPQDNPQSEPFHEWHFPDGTPWTRFYRCDFGYLLRFPEIADFQVSRDGGTVRCWPLPETTDDTIQHLYQNQVLPLALSKQGKLVFHACAVEAGDTGIVFMGASGRGKSTLAASFAASGHRFLTDDGLVMEAIDDIFRILPGHPSIRLWEDSQMALAGDKGQLSPPVVYTPKSRILADDNLAFCPEPRRLRRVYFLGEGNQEKPVFMRLEPNEALIELVRHSFLLDIEERELLDFHFHELSRLVGQSDYYRLDYPRQFADLARVREAILAHLHEDDL